MLKFFLLFFVINFNSYECLYEELVFVIELGSFSKPEHFEFIKDTMKEKMNSFEDGTFRKYRIIQFNKTYNEVFLKDTKDVVLNYSPQTANYSPICEKKDLNNATSNAVNKIISNTYVLVFTTNVNDNYMFYINELQKKENVTFDIQFMYSICEDVEWHVIDSIATKTNLSNIAYIHEKYKNNERKTIIPLNLYRVSKIQFNISASTVTNKEEILVKDSLDFYYNSSQDPVNLFVYRRGYNPISSLLLYNPNDGVWIISVSNYSGILNTDKIFELKNNSKEIEKLSYDVLKQVLLAVIFVLLIYLCGIWCCIALLKMCINRMRKQSK